MRSVSDEGWTDHKAIAYMMHTNGDWPRCRCDGRLMVGGRFSEFDHQLGRTWLRRPELLANRVMNKEELCLLQEFKRAVPSVPTKSGLMAGLGETDDEILQVMRDLRVRWRIGRGRRANGFGRARLIDFDDIGRDRRLEAPPDQRAGGGCSPSATVRQIGKIA